MFSSSKAIKELGALNINRAEDLADRDRWFRFCMPYHIEHLEDPQHKHAYLPVNREYKPLGITSSNWVHYEDYRSQAMVFVSDPAAFEDIWIRRGNGLWLYSDSPESRLDYFARLERLLNRSVKLLEKASR
jgi:hypothetical protein